MGGRERRRHGCWKRISALAVSALLPGVIVPPSASPETTAQDSGRAFEPRPLSAALYDKGQTISGYVTTTADGPRIYVETVLPGARNGNVPPPKVPVVLMMTPYGAYESQEIPPYVTTVFEHLVRHGYAFTFAHVLGTGGSEGCIQVGGPKEVDATAQVIAHLAAQEWSNGRVGMWGGSYHGMTQIGAAGLDDPRVRPLRAIVPFSAPVSWIENAAFDGVPSVPGITLGWVLYNGAWGSTVGRRSPNPTVLDDRHACAPDNLVHAAHHDVSSELSDYWRERDYRWNVGNIRAATLMFHGFADSEQSPLGLSGFFERLPASTPRKLLLGQWAHEVPHRQNTHPEWRRADFLSMLVAWYDRYLLDLPTGVEAWPNVQVQDTSGQWRAEPSWPAPTHRYGHLPLSAGGTLGAAAPTGATTYSEAGAPAPVVTFTTPPLPDDLHLTGQSVLDLWVRLDRPDAHIGVNIEALDASGNAIGPVAFFGARSARHLDPMPDNWFHQERGTDPEVSKPVRVPVRLAPVDFLVPKGGRLTVTVGASVPYINDFPSAPSGAGTTVTILHDCTTMSALRFFLPNQDADLLNVLEPDEVKDPPEPLASHPARRLATDGGGMATGPACDKRPVNPLSVLAGTA